MYTGLISNSIIKSMKNEKTSDAAEQRLTHEEEEFCNLYVCGGIQFAGQHCKCYKEVFYADQDKALMSGRQLLSKPYIQAHIKKLVEKEHADMETIAVKLQVAETLKAVMEETATSNYEDKFGVSLSPAPLRAVSVNAAKALMELYPIKHSQEARIKIEGESGVIFNVVIPTPNKDENES